MEIKAPVEEEKKVLVTKSLESISSNSISINEVLNPKQDSEEAVRERIKEENDFTFDELQRYWREYALHLKSQGRDRIHSTLTTSKLNMSSDYVLTLEINSTQQQDIDLEKEELMTFLRKKLRNGKIGFKYVIAETEKIEILDSKATFEKLAEENESLNKFRTLFQLDIEY